MKIRLNKEQVPVSHLTKVDMLLVGSLQISIGVWLIDRLVVLNDEYADLLQAREDFRTLRLGSSITLLPE